MEGDLAYIGQGDYGALQIIDVSNPATPILRGGYTTDRSFKVQAVGSLVYLTAGYGGLQIVRTSVGSTFSISGRVTDVDHNSVSGVLISTGVGPTALTDGNGNYTLGGLEAGTYTLTPSKEAYTFSPISRIVQVSGDVIGVDFTAAVGATAVTPLIFIPGIAGSYLYKPTVTNLFCGREVWPGTPSCHDDLILDSTGTSPTLYSPGVIRYTAGGSIYGPLLQMLATTGGYREYNLYDQQGQLHLERVTTTGCDSSQSQSTLYVFAYDWRLSNALNAVRLADYVGCIQKIHPGAKVDILTHSMGGLIARRYTMNYPGTVNKLITIAAPWLGAPKAINVLETGDFGLPPIIVAESTIAQAAQYDPGAQQLLPSKSYFNLGGKPFAERGWNIDGRGNSSEMYNHDQLVAMLNEHYPFNHPYTTNPGTRTDYDGPVCQDTKSGDDPCSLLLSLRQNA